MIYKSYSNSTLATIISVFSAGFYCVGAVCAICAFQESGEELWGMLATGAFFVVFAFALGKWASHIANKKYDKQVAKSQMQVQSTQPKTMEPIVVKQEIKNEEVKKDEIKSNSAETWKCKKCGTENKGKFCEECGSPRPPKERFCTNCGAKLKANQKFCGECGTKI